MVESLVLTMPVIGGLLNRSSAFLRVDMNGSKHRGRESFYYMSGTKHPAPKLRA